MRLKQIAYLSIMACLLWPTTVLSTPYFWDGNKLYSHCGDSAPAHQDMCASYILGVVDVLSGLKALCLPKNMTVRQVVDIVTEHLRDSPETRHYPATYGISTALASFHCKNSN
jgi:Rap1a immunity proteins